MNEAKVAYYFEKLMEEGLGLDLSDPNLSKTPERVARMYCREFFKNIKIEFSDVAVFPNSNNYDQVIGDGCFFVSTCAHHFIPFYGHAWVFYLPNRWLLGKSKMTRIVAHYAARPQLQENLCHDVIDCIDTHAQPHGAMVIIKAIHTCTKCRGVNQYTDRGMMTSAVKGDFLKNSDLKMEALEMIKLHSPDG